MTGGSGSYGASDHTSSTPTATSQPNYTPPAERHTNIPMSQAGADFRATVEGNINNTNAEIQQGQTKIEQKADPVKQKVNATQGASVHNNLKKKLGEESLKSVQDAYEYLTDKQNITGEK